MAKQITKKGVKKASVNKTGRVSKNIPAKKNIKTPSPFQSLSSGVPAITGAKN